MKLVDVFSPVTQRVTPEADKYVLRGTYSQFIEPLIPKVVKDTSENVLPGFGSAFRDVGHTRALYTYEGNTVQLQTGAPARAVIDAYFVDGGFFGTGFAFGMSFGALEQFVSPFHLELIQNNFLNSSLNDMVIAGIVFAGVEVFHHIFAPRISKTDNS